MLATVFPLPPPMDGHGARPRVVSANARHTLTSAMHTHEMPIRVRYPECDPMGFVHHGVFATWFEMGRSEMMRAGGFTYRSLEESGRLLPVVEINIRYRKPAHYDDELVLVSKMVDVTRAKIIFEYELYRDGTLLATGRTVNACIDRDGRLLPVPDEIFDAFHVEKRLRRDS